MKILLLFSDNDRKGRDFEEIVELQEEALRLGRVSESNDIVLKSSSVSRQHAKIRVRHGALQVCDLGSFNGTFLEKTKLTKNDGYVSVEDQLVRFGSLNMKWKILSDTRAPPPSTSAPTTPPKEYNNNRPRKKRRSVEEREIFRPNPCDCDAKDLEYVRVESYTLFGTWC